MQINSVRLCGMAGFLLKMLFGVQVSSGLGGCT